MDNTSPVLHFAGLLESTNKKQRIALLENITQGQCLYIREIAYNLLFNDSLNYTEKTRTYLKNNISQLKILASRKICLAEKKHILVKKQQFVKKIAKIVLDYFKANNNKSN